MALTALGASLLAGVDAITCLIRGAIAYGVGLFAASLWCAFSQPRSALVSAVKPAPEGAQKEEQPKAA